MLKKKLRQPSSTISCTSQVLPIKNFREEKRKLRETKAAGNQQLTYKFGLKIANVEADATKQRDRRYGNGMK